MENSAQEASDSAQEASGSGNQGIEEAIDTEMSTLSITGVSEDMSMSRAMFSPVQCEDQENTLYKVLSELDAKVPYIIDGIENGEMVLLCKNSNGNLEDVYLRFLNCDVSHANTVVEPCSADDKKVYLDASFTLIRILKACKFPKGVVFNSSKLCLNYGEYREKFEYSVEAALGTGLYGKVDRIFDKRTLSTCARKKVPISDFREEEVMALIDLSGTGVTPDIYGHVIEGNDVCIFMEEITNGIPLSDLIPRFQKSEHRALIVRYLLYDLLVALFKIHLKRWKQNDLHEGNILMQIKQDVSIVSRIVDFGEAIDTEEGADFRKEYEQAGKVYKDILTAVSEESVLDKSARQHIQFLMRKVSDITAFRQLIEKGYAHVQLPRDAEKALREICSDAAGFKAASSNKDRNFKGYMKSSTSGGSTASEDEDDCLLSLSPPTSTEQMQPPKVANFQTEKSSISLETQRCDDLGLIWNDGMSNIAPVYMYERGLSTDADLPTVTILPKEKERWQNDAIVEPVSKTHSESLEQYVFKWLDEHPDSFKKYLVNREVNSIQESNHQDPDMVKTQVQKKLRKFEQEQDHYLQDINTHQNHADSKVSEDGVVRGNIHQASRRFKHDATGTQCTSICAIAAVVANFKHPSKWSQDDINNIVINGDKEHVRELNKRGWPNKRTESRLAVDELPKNVSLVHGSVTLKANIDVTGGTSSKLISQIEDLVKETVNTSIRQSFILTMLDKCRTVLCHGNGCYSVFDPHSCDASGFPDPTGTACVLHFDNIYRLVNFLKNLVTDQDTTQQVDLTQCIIEVEWQEDIGV